MKKLRLFQCFHVSSRRKVSWSLESTLSYLYAFVQSCVSDLIVQWWRSAINELSLLYEIDQVLFIRKFSFEFYKCKLSTMVSVNFLFGGVILITVMSATKLNGVAAYPARPPIDCKSDDGHTCSKVISEPQASFGTGPPRLPRFPKGHRKLPTRCFGNCFSTNRCHISNISEPVASMYHFSI